ncbi:hypothetical protein DEO72_LG4g2202 [Vigna unguiculata]|uniref:Uncharacterized protein n=1 Tax=Vigna unguiculata TaxID=3917 RepID=A0A4D6LRN4_VIGUN|nr:hypothetical protein DEO72_LG4g2202 [Vigna unguiculata]
MMCIRDRLSPLEAMEAAISGERCHQNFEADLHKCINLTESIEEFESCWSCLIDWYDLTEFG